MYIYLITYYMLNDIENDLFPIKSFSLYILWSGVFLMREDGL